MCIRDRPRALECCHRIEEVLEHQPEIRDLVSADENDAAHGDAVLEFKSVSFKYKDAEEYTLKDMSFTCRRGQTTAVIGGTGSGKSTVASLILRFHDVSEGGVLLNGRDIRCLLYTSRRKARLTLTHMPTTAIYSA